MQKQLCRIIDKNISLAYDFADEPSSDLFIAGKTATCTTCVVRRGVVSITTNLAETYGFKFWTNVDGRNGLKR